MYARRSLTASSNIVIQVHGGSSGIGTFAIQIAKHLGIRVFVTAGLTLLNSNDQNFHACLVTNRRRYIRILLIYQEAKKNWLRARILVLTPALIIRLKTLWRE